jgi:drug/metabolite transporter (DMT)-like permease
MITRPSARALAALMLLALIWGYNWVVMKIALADIGPFQFGALRALFGGVLLCVLVLVLRRPIRVAEIRTVALMGLLQTTGFTGLITLALVSGGAGKTAVLAYTMPLWVMLLAWPLLGERLSGGQWLSAGAALAGLLCIIDPLHLAGDLLSTFLATLAGVCWALAVIVAKRLQARAPDVDVLAVAAWQSLIGALPLIVVALWWPAQPINWTPSLIGALLFNIVPGTAIAWLLWLYALRRLSAGTTGMVSLITPAIGVLFAAWQLGERPSPGELAGMLLICTGLALLSLEALRRGRAQPGR